MKFFTLLLSVIALAILTHKEPVPPGQPCETYEQGCQRSSHPEEYDPEREVSPDNPDHPGSPGDFF